MSKPFIFQQGKYLDWYEAIVERARARTDGIGEWHHVIPKCLGGTEMVLLTYREHFITHWLLTKFTAGDARVKMLHALAMMMVGRDTSSWQFERARAARREALKSREFSAVTREKLSLRASQRTGEKSHWFGKKRPGHADKVAKHKTTCPFCQKTVINTAYPSWHGANCKENPDIPADVLAARLERMKNMRAKRA